MQFILSTFSKRAGVLLCLTAFLGAAGFVSGPAYGKPKITKGDAAIAKRSAKSYIKLRVVDKARMK